jgi:hypothetical protein
MRSARRVFGGGCGAVMAPNEIPPFYSGGIRNVFFTYSMLARVSAMMSSVGEPVSRMYQPR